MITFIPKSLAAINTASISSATTLDHPLSQLGKLDVATNVNYLVDEHLFTTPAFQGLLQLLEQEHYEWRFVVGGGRDAEERRHAAAWAFLPLRKGSQITLDDLIEGDKQQQSLVSSKQSVVAPTLSAMRAATNARPGAKPALEMLQLDPAPNDEDEGDGDNT